MKLFATLISIAIWCISANAGEIVFQNTHAVVFTNTFTSTNFVASGSITNVQTSLFTTYHTLQGFYGSVGTNAVATTNIVDSSLDGINWIPEQTNSWTTNGSFQYTLTGKRSALRTRLYFITTNATFTLNYFAQ